MAHQKELINILKAELTLLSQEILQNIHQKDINDLYKSVRKLYEKMAAIHVLDKKIKVQEDLAEIFAEVKPKEEILPETPVVPEKTVEKIEKPEEIVAEKPIVEEKQAPAKKEILSQEDLNPYQQEITFVPKQKETQKTEPVSIPDPAPNVHLKKMSIGLNDRIAFIKNLFNGDDQAYMRTIEKLNAFDQYETALKYIYSEVKPLYNNWEGKDEYEFRLIQLLELKFN